MLLKDKKVCANCIYKYYESHNLGYDHYGQLRCKKNNGRACSDVWNTTCDDFEFNKEENNKKADIIPMYPKLTENEYTFVFYTDRPLTHDEKMKISSKGLSVLNEILETELGNIAEHQSSFYFK